MGQFSRLRALECDLFLICLSLTPGFGVLLGPVLAWQPSIPFPAMSARIPPSILCLRSCSSASACCASVAAGNVYTLLVENGTGCPFLNNRQTPFRYNRNPQPGNAWGSRGRTCCSIRIP